MARDRTTRLTKDAWINEALEVLRRQGVEGVAVEPLAKRLGVTKGSFYWHFKNRDALLKEVLRTWEHRASTEFLEALDPIQDPAERLRGLFRLLGERLSVLRTEAALANGFATPVVRPFVKRVTDRRFEFLLQAYTELGLPRTDARRWAVFGLAAYMGTVQLIATRRDLFPTDDALRDYVQHSEGVFVPKPK